MTRDYATAWSRAVRYCTLPSNCTTTGVLLAFGRMPPAMAVVQDAVDRGKRRCPDRHGRAQAPSAWPYKKRKGVQ